MDFSRWHHKISRAEIYLLVMEVVILQVRLKNKMPTDGVTPDSGLDWLRLLILMSPWAAIGHLYMARDRDRKDHSKMLTDAIAKVEAQFTVTTTRLEAKFDAFRQTVETEQREAWRQREILAGLIGRLITREELGVELSKIGGLLKDLKPNQRIA